MQCTMQTFRAVCTFSTEALRRRTPIPIRCLSSLVADWDRAQRSAHSQTNLLVFEDVADMPLAEVWPALHLNTLSCLSSMFPGCHEKLMLSDFTQAPLYSRSYRIIGTDTYVDEDDVEYINGRNAHRKPIFQDKLVAIDWSEMSESKQNIVRVKDVCPNGQWDHLRLFLLTSPLDRDLYWFPDSYEYAGPHSPRRLVQSLYNYFSLPIVTKEECEGDAQKWPAIHRRSRRLMDKSWWLDSPTHCFDAHVSRLYSQLMSIYTNCRSPVCDQDIASALANVVLYLYPIGPGVAADLWEQFPRELQEFTPYDWDKPISMQTWPSSGLSSCDIVIHFEDDDKTETRSYLVDDQFEVTPATIPQLTMDMRTLPLSMFGSRGVVKAERDVEDHTMIHIWLGLPGSKKIANEPATSSEL